MSIIKSWQNILNHGFNGLKDCTDFIRSSDTASTQSFIIMNDISPDTNFYNPYLLYNYKNLCNPNNPLNP